MSRFALVAILLVACSSHESPSAPATAPTPVEVPKPPPFPTETPALVGAEALAFLPDTTRAVGVASSLDRLEAAISPPVVPVVQAVTGLAPAGLSRSRPVGVATVGVGWVVFGYVDDAKALAASVPAKRLATRGELAFVADDPYTIERLLPAKGTAKRAPDLASEKRFRASVDALHHGALVAWWIAGRGAAGLSVDGKMLRVRAVDGVPVFGDDAHARAVRFARSTGLLGVDVPKALQEKRRAAYDVLDAAEEQLEAARRKVIDDTRAQVGVAATAKPAVERTFEVPAASVKAWAAPLVERWLAATLADKVHAAETQVAAIDKQVKRAEDAAMSRMFGTAGLDAQLAQFDAMKMADVLGGADDHGRPSGGYGGLAVGGAGGGVGMGDIGMRGGGGGTGRGYGGGVGMIGHGAYPTVKLAGGGDAQLRAHVQGRLERVRTCYDRAREKTADLRASVQVAVEADADGRVTVKASGADASLGGCIEIAVRGTAAGAKSVSATFTIELAPS